MDAGDLICMRCSVDDHVGTEADVNEVAHENFGWGKYWDDATGKELKKELVEAARAEELQVVRAMGVWRHVARDMRTRVTGSC